VYTELLPSTGLGDDTIETSMIAEQCKSQLTAVSREVEMQTVCQNGLL